MEKQLGWVLKSDGPEPLGMSKVGQTVLARLMESQIGYLHAGSVALLGEGSERGQGPLPAFLSGRRLLPATTLMPDTSVSPYMPVVPFNLLPWYWSSEGMSLSRLVHVWVL